ncbi:MAG: S41 family peptidase [Candidatus Caldatribacteriota bacterium]
MFNRKNLTFLKVIFIVAILFSSIIINPVNANGNYTIDDFEFYSKLSPFFEALDILREKYIQKDLDLTKLIQGAIKGMLETLDDPYTRYMDPQSLKREQEDMFYGHFGGLGIIITVRDEQLTVISPIEDTPAYQAGIKAGDIIVEIDGKPTTGMGLDEAVNILRGDKGTPVTVGIQREGNAEVIYFNIIRDIIEVTAVKGKILEDSKIGYIRITSFNVNTEPELRKVLDEFKKNELIQGIILDLRNNPGGLLDSAIEVASKFIAEGTVVYVKDRDGIEISIPSLGNQYPQWPLVVLINEGSASASEIVAGAIKDRKRGILVGNKSFGKGLVQQVFSLSDDSGVVITTSEYFTPNQININNIGIEPDILVKQDEEGNNNIDSEEKDVQLDKAIEILKEEMDKVAAKINF